VLLTRFICQVRRARDLRGLDPRTIKCPESLYGREKSLFTGLYSLYKPESNEARESCLKIHNSDKTLILGPNLSFDSNEDPVDKLKRLTLFLTDVLCRNKQSAFADLYGLHNNS
jgi:hypothetical protein